MKYLKKYPKAILEQFSRLSIKKRVITTMELSSKKNTKNKGQTFAIKKVFTSTSNKKLRSMVEREIRILTSLNHENIIKIYGHKLKETSVTLILEYAESDLFTFISQSVYPLSSQILKTILKSLLSGLNELHRNGLIHRDLKPSNILINQKGVVKIGDFGSAISLSDKKNGAFSIEGFSRWYKAPELLFGSRDYNNSIDIWAMGCIFGELINGFPLFPGVNEIDQLGRIGEVLGSPTPENWKTIINMPDYGKITFKETKGRDFIELFPNALDVERLLLAKMLKYDNRITAEEALKDSYFIDDKIPLKTIKLKNKKEEKWLSSNYFNYMDLSKR